MHGNAIYANFTTRKGMPVMQVPSSIAFCAPIARLICALVLNRVLP